MAGMHELGARSTKGVKSFQRTLTTCFLRHSQHPIIALWLKPSALTPYEHECGTHTDVRVELELERLRQPFGMGGAVAVEGGGEGRHKHHTQKCCPYRVCSILN